MAESKSSSRVFLLSSLALGVLAMVAAFVYLENTAGQERGPKVTILVAKRDLRETSALDPEKDLDEMEISGKLASLRSRALAPEDKATYKGQRLNRTVLAGTPVWMADLAAAGTIELKGDSRALSISVRGAQALGGLIVPGDLVKLLVTRPAATARPTSMPAGDAPLYMDAPQATRWETVLVAPTTFKILAVNQRMSRSRAQVTAADQYQSAGESNSQQTVTLEVTEAQAKQILEQTGAGQLAVTLLLCPPNAPAGGVAQ